MMKSDSPEELSTHECEIVDFLVQTSLTLCNQHTQWYAQLAHNERTYLRIIVQTAVSDYLLHTHRFSHDLTNHEEDICADHLFELAPLETSTKISLDNVIDSIRIVVKTIENHIHDIAPQGEENAYIRSALCYSREIGFAAARFYARIATTRAIWDARDESFIIDSLLEHDYSESLLSRIERFHWKDNENFFAVVGNLEPKSTLRIALAHNDVRSAISNLGGQVCMSTHDNCTVILVSVSHHCSIQPFLETITDHLDHSSHDSAICFGPLLSGLEGASTTLHSALQGFNACKALPQHNNPLSSQAVLAERALFGDEEARHELYNDVYLPIKMTGKKTEILSTLETYLLSGLSLEDTSHTLAVHKNTVRYRLKKVHQITGWNPMDPRDAYVLISAIKIGLYNDN